MRHAFFIAHAHGAVDNSGGVFRQRVIGAELETGLAAVVINAHAAADIQVLHARAQLGKLHIRANEFVHAGVDLANLVNLTAHVAMQKFETILHAAGAQIFKHLKHFAET